MNVDGVSGSCPKLGFPFYAWAVLPLPLGLWMNSQATTSPPHPAPSAPRSSRRTPYGALFYSLALSTAEMSTIDREYFRPQSLFNVIISPVKNHFGRLITVIYAFYMNRPNVGAVIRLRIGTAIALFVNMLRYFFLVLQSNMMKKSDYHFVMSFFYKSVYYR